MASAPSNAFQHAGRVSAINTHGSAKHATIDVTHGKRKRSKGLDGSPGELQSYDQPRSSVIVPKQHAKNFTVGQHVNVGVTPRTDGGGTDDGDDGTENDQMGDTDEYPVQSAPAPGAKGGKSGKGGKKRAPGQRPILQAMTRNRGAR